MLDSRFQPRASWVRNCAARAIIVAMATILVIGAGLLGLFLFDVCMGRTRFRDPQIFHIPGRLKEASTG